MINSDQFSIWNQNERPLASNKKSATYVVEDTHSVCKAGYVQVTT